MFKPLPTWWPDHPAIYDIKKTYQENFDQGPFFEGKLPKRVYPPKDEWCNFLGFEVASPLGVPAGPLLNSRWVKLAANLGFDIVTYKTIRSKPYPAHPLPNMIYVDTKGVLTAERSEEVLHQAETPPSSMHSLAATNSFGIPSQDAEFLLRDIDAGNRAMGPGQVMVVSIVGTPRAGEDFVQDFVLAAEVALNAGSKIIEADLSCPNVSTKEGSLFTDADSIEIITRALKKTMGAVPLILKLGMIYEPEVLKQVMLAAARGGAQAICGINTLSMQVVKGDGTSALGPGRLRSGVCGGPIHEAALFFTRMASQINKQEKLGFTLMSTGGVVEPEQFDSFFDAGADVAMSACGMMWDPYLAERYHRWKQSS